MFEITAVIKLLDLRTEMLNSNVSKLLPAAKDTAPYRNGRCSLQQDVLRGSFFSAVFCSAHCIGTGSTELLKSFQSAERAEHRTLGFA